MKNLKGEIVLDIKDLKSREYGNVSKYVSMIKFNLKHIFEEVEESKVFATAYLAYLVKKGNLSTKRELINYIERKLPESQQLFLIDRTSDAYWMKVLEIAEELSLEALLATVVLYPYSGFHNTKEIATPESIVKLAYGILNPKNEYVADLCSGVGSFLSYVAMQEDESTLYGVETKAYPKVISEIILSFFENEAEIVQGSALEIPKNKKFDKIFCEYPWNLNSRYLSDDEKEAVLADGLIPELEKTSRTEWYFIMNVVNHLSENGKAVVYAPNAITWDEDRLKIIRERFIKLGLLEAAITIPEEIVSPYARVSSVLLVLSKNKSDSVRFIDASELELVNVKNRGLFYYYKDETIEEILTMLDSDGKYSKKVSIDEIAKKDYVINPVRYLESEIKVKNGVPFESLIKNITRGVQMRAAGIEEMISDTPTPYRYLKLTDIQDGLINEDLPYLKEIDEKQKKYCLKNRSLVISKTVNSLKVAVADVAEGQQILVSGNLYIIELDETKANPYYVKSYLESEQGTVALSRISVGSVIANIPISKLTKLMIPNPSIAFQNKVAEKYLTKVDEIKLLRYRLQKATDDLKKIFEEE